MIYLDNSATTAVCKPAADKAYAVMTEQFGNPSSLHSLGIQAEAELTEARRILAERIGATEAEIVFTSGGTEANNLAILGAARARKRRGLHIIRSAIEHPSVSAAFDRLAEEGFEVTVIPPQADGSVASDDVVAACRPDTVLVSVMLVNNETGALFPMEKAAPRIRKKSPLAAIHTDAVQAFGKLPIQVGRLGVDLLSFSGHKLYAPKGIGGLYCRKGTRLLSPAALGGGQEKGIRSGTENVPAAAAFGAAVASLPPIAESQAHFAALKERLVEGIQTLPDTRLHLPQNGVPYIVNFSLMGLRSETLIHFLAEREIYVSGGSACAKGHASPVLTAMNLPPAEIDSALRVSFGSHNTPADVDALVSALRTAADTLTHRR